MMLNIESDIPIHIKNAFSSWKDYPNFFDQLLSGNLSNTILQWRITPYQWKKTIRECDSLTINATCKDFNDWMNGKEIHHSNPFKICPSYNDKVISIYADYKHFNGKYY